MLISAFVRGQTSDPQILETAADSADKAIKADPKFAQAYLYKGLAYEQLGRPAALVRPLFEQYLHLDPNGPQAMMARSVLSRLAGAGPTTTAKP